MGPKGLADVDGAVGGTRGRRARLVPLSLDRLIARLRGGIRVLFSGYAGFFFTSREASGLDWLWLAVPCLDWSSRRSNCSILSSTS